MQFIPSTAFPFSSPEYSSVACRLLKYLLILIPSTNSSFSQANFIVFFHLRNTSGPWLTLYVLLFIVVMVSWFLMFANIFTWLVYVYSLHWSWLFKIILPIPSIHPLHQSKLFIRTYLNLFKRTPKTVFDVNYFKSYIKTYCCKCPAKYASSFIL